MLNRISTKIFADGADPDSILRLSEDSMVKGFTTNPTLMWKAGLTDYADFGRRLLEQIRDRPILFEVLADEEAEMRRQAKQLAAWGPNVSVKIPVMTLLKVKNPGKDLDQCSLETVQMLHRDAAASGFTL